MRIDLGDEILFDKDEILFDKKINFVYGKNGTGKSTLCRLISEQYGTTKDINLYQGFEELVGENRKLNAVLLGTENIEITEEINKLEKNIEAKENEKETVLKRIKEPENSEDENYYTKYRESNELWKEQNKKIEEFKKNTAKEIKNLNDPQISKPTYNKKDFESEILKAEKLTSENKDILEKILKSDVKKANYININDLDLNELLLKTNNLLSKKVEEEVLIERIDNNEKRYFAEKGLQIHKDGDVCAFCGNQISEGTIVELKKYFDADKVKKIETAISEFIKEIESKKAQINTISVDDMKFYVDYQEKVDNCKKRLDDAVLAYSAFFDNLIQSLNEKKGKIFVGMEKIELCIPSNIKTEIESYNKLVKDNNKNELEQKQEEAKKKLRYHYIKIKLENFKYDVECNELVNRKRNEDECFRKIEEEKSTINKIDGEIKALKTEISELQKETISEKILAENINKKLKDYVAFELIYYESSKSKGYYQIKDLQTGKTRDVTELSKGEKNIIAFLYFIERRADINRKSDKSRVIVFDDPMTSNDDTMQYIMIMELQALMKSLKESETFILLTHNAHFYINITWNLKGKNKYKSNNFYRLISSGFETKVNRINAQDEDLKTSYSGLWYDLNYLYNDEKSRPEILINIIRRIIETFCKFNAIKTTEFYENIPEANKFFNVNSHSIDDLEMDLNGRSKHEILGIMEKCFNENGYINHFEAHWKYTE